MQIDKAVAKAPTEATPKPVAQSGAESVLDLAELALALDLSLETHPIFVEAVKAAIRPLRGEFLFELPHGKPGAKGRIAAMRFALANSHEPLILFATLGDDGLETALTRFEEQPEHLQSFAQSFVSVFETFGAGKTLTH